MQCVRRLMIFIVKCPRLLCVLSAFPTEVCFGKYVWLNLIVNSTQTQTRLRFQLSAARHTRAHVLILPVLNYSRYARAATRLVAFPAVPPSQQYGIIKLTLKALAMRTIKTHYTIMSTRVCVHHHRHRHYHHWRRRRRASASAK